MMPHIMYDILNTSVV